VKGLLDEAIFEQARICNFSGRNLPTVDAEAFTGQVARLEEYDVSGLMGLVGERFAEPALWNVYLNDIEQAAPVRETVLGLMYRKIVEPGFPLNGPYLRSHALMDAIEESFGNMQDVDPDILRTFKHQKGLLENIIPSDIVAICDNDNAENVCIQEDIYEVIQDEYIDKSGDVDALNDTPCDSGREQERDESSPELSNEPPNFKAQEVEVRPFVQEVETCGMVMAEVNIEESCEDRHAHGSLDTEEMASDVPPVAMAMEKIRESESKGAKPSGCCAHPGSRVWPRLFTEKSRVREGGCSTATCSHVSVDPSTMRPRRGSSRAFLRSCPTTWSSFQAFPLTMLAAVSGPLSWPDVL
jgi:hypothetical protein